ncbi:olfactory receptor 5V1-like [Gastrophryne carolinensis]
MEPSNQTSEFSFILLGLSDDPYYQVLYFVIFLVIYIITLTGNLLLILVANTNSTLQRPMYFFLANLSIIDICFSSSAVPKLMMTTLNKDKTITLLECSVQMYVHMAMGGAECTLLAIMAYDRFAAICRPLNYSIIMTKTFCMRLVAVSWSVGFLNSWILVIPTLKLPFCQSNHINHFFCEIPPLLQIACADTWSNILVIYISAGIIVMCCFFFTLGSYSFIISTILKIHVSGRRHKTFSTCASHLTVVTIYYGTIMFMYMRPPNTYFPKVDKTVSIVYTAVTPMLNPFIYSILNKDFRGTFRWAKKSCT